MKQNFKRKKLIGGNEDLVENLLYTLSNLGDDFIKNENFPRKIF